MMTHQEATHLARVLYTPPRSFEGVSKRLLVDLKFGCANAKLGNLSLVRVEQVDERVEVLAMPQVDLVLGGVRDSRQLERLAHVREDLRLDAREDREQRIAKEEHPGDRELVEPQPPLEEPRECVVGLRFAERVDGRQRIPVLERVLDEPLPRFHTRAVLAVLVQRRVFETAGDDREVAALAHQAGDVLLGGRLEAPGHVAKDLEERRPLAQVAGDQEDGAGRLRLVKVALGRQLIEVLVPATVAHEASREDAVGVEH